MQASVLQRDETATMRDLGFDTPEREAAMMACSPDCIKLLSADGAIAYMSQNGLCAMEIPALSNILGKFWPDLWPESQRDLVASAVTAAGQGKTVNFVADCPTALGNPARWDVTVQGVFAPDGQLIEIISVSRLTKDPLRALSVVQT
ncbi:PAS domain-containing protein [Tateyamaria armeniaca]|uniref:PAS domain-containing protein n=1 Tax=Tateyamaria armeniaca TaxID=2518930 RepID=A0ABW8UXX8_9RHOB